MVGLYERALEANPWPDPRPPSWLRTPTRREVAAYHEAGHAVVALWFKMPIRHVSIDDFGNGSTLLKVARSARFENLCLDLAGAYAEAAFCGDGAMSPKDKASYDAYAKRLSPQQCAAAAYETTQILKDDWHFVEAIADALLRYGRLTGDQLYKFVKEIENA